MQKAYIKGFMKTHWSQCMLTGQLLTIETVALGLTTESVALGLTTETGIKPEIRNTYFKTMKDLGLVKKEVLYTLM